MKKLNNTTVNKAVLPIKIMQFGEGNFLRAFADWMIEKMNVEHDYGHGVAIVQPISQGMTQMLCDQSSLYHHIMRGLKDGEPFSETRMITCIQEALNPFESTGRYFEIGVSEGLEIVMSNTTEAGIVFDSQDLLHDNQLPITFPGKLTQLLWKRFNVFNGAADKGLKFIPVELIEKNGEKLKEAILNYAELWLLPKGFSEWIEKYNYFANTLVDRIVPGYPKDEIEEIHANIGYEDNLVVSSELFYLWVMDAPLAIQKAFPADKMGLNVVYTKDLDQYRTRKVRILNGAHTAMVPIGLLNGVDTVREAIEDEVIGSFIGNVIAHEIAPTIDLPQVVLDLFAAEVLERFKNPFIRHELKSIALNSISKYKVRVLPTVLDYVQLKGELPTGLVMALAHLIKLYLSDSFRIQDSAEVVTYFKDLKSKNFNEHDLVAELTGNVALWGMNLNEVAGFSTLLEEQITFLNKGKGIKEIKLERI